MYTIAPKTDAGIDRITITRKTLRTLWVNTGSQCPYQCPTCHLQSSPTNKALAFMTTKDLQPYLNEFARLTHSFTSTVAFTGGEPFMNPHFLKILHSTLMHKGNFNVLILTTATATMLKHEDALNALLQDFGRRITIRVSLDGTTPEAHTAVRHNPSYKKEPPLWGPMLAGLQWLTKRECVLGITGRVLPGKTPEESLKEYQNFLDTQRITIDSENIVLFSAPITNYDSSDTDDFHPQAITANCMETYGKNPEDLMCHDSLMLVKPHDGNGRIAIAPCTIIPYNKSYRVYGKGLKEVMETPMPLAHQNCVWCLGGNHCAKA